MTDQETQSDTPAAPPEVQATEATGQMVDGQLTSSIDAVYSDTPSFPAIFPTKSVLRLVALVRGGELKGNKAEALVLAAWIVGCSVTAAGGLDGSETVSALSVQVGSAQGQSLETACDSLEALCESVDASVASMSAVTVVSLVLRIMKLIGDLR